MFGYQKAFETMLRPDKMLQAAFRPDRTLENILVAQRAFNNRPQAARKTAPKMVYREEPVVIVGGFMSSPNDYIGWQHLLCNDQMRRRSIIAPINRTDWAMTRNADFRGQIKALDNAVRKARQTTGSEKVWLLCHSAGGTIARLWMGDRAFKGEKFEGHRYVRGVIFLGTPYQSSESNARAAVNFANEAYPGAFFDEVSYISIIGKSVFGRPNGSFMEKMAYRTYLKVSPERPQQWGDGVITLDAAFVPGAENVTVDKIYHVSLMGQPGYGSPKAVKIWSSYLLQDGLNQEGLPATA